MTVAAWVVACACVAGALLVVARRGRPATPLPLADAAALVAATRRSSLLRALLLATLVAALLVLVIQTRARGGERPLLSSGGDAVVVVDLSSSTRSASRSIAHALSGLANDPRRHVGLVLFSNVAYEALPPSTPADAFAGWVDRFASSTAHATPWSSFSSGTTISTGLVLARQILHRAGTAHPRVILVSDLVDPSSDLQRLETAVAQYQRDGIELQVVRLLPASHAATAAAAFEVPNAQIVESAASTTVTARPASGAGGDHGRLLVLAALVAALALLAAVHELAFHPFSWGARA
jgi:hypothetical protein